MLTRSDEDELKLKALEYAAPPGQRVWVKARDALTAVDARHKLSVISLLLSHPHSLSHTLTLTLSLSPSHSHSSSLTLTLSPSALALLPSHPPCAHRTPTHTDTPPHAAPVLQVLEVTQDMTNSSNGPAGFRVHGSMRVVDQDSGADLDPTGQLAAARIGGGGAGGGGASVVSSV